MIFSTVSCPICGSDLKYETIYRANTTEVAYHYYCTTKVSARNIANTGKYEYNHYENRVTDTHQVAFMIIPPFELVHSTQLGITAVSKVSDVECKKFLFQAPLLDYDYADTQTVVSRLKLLVTFS